MTPFRAGLLLLAALPLLCGAAPHPRNSSSLCLLQVKTLDTGNLSKRLQDDVNETANETVLLSFPSVSWLTETDFELQDDKPPSERDLFFRPVSVTLYCVMGLTLQSILIHTGEAVARNVDELSAALEPSYVSEVLGTAGRSVPLAPVMSLLFLANRLSMLESTGGLGRVEWWVKLCIMGATAGMTFQLMTIFSLSLTTLRGALRFSEEGGDVRDAHPHVLRYTFIGLSSRAFNMIMQGGSLIGIYGGVLGVILGMVLNGRGDVESSAANCTAAIVVLYFGIQLLVWASHTVGTLDVFERAFRQAALRSEGVVQKAPMFAVLVLSTRLRQVQEGKQGGTPDALIVAAFATIAASLYVEVLLCPFAGSALDEEETDEEEPRPTPRWVRFLEYLQAFASGLGFAAAAVVASAIVSPPGVAVPLPMSPTVHSVMALCLLCFIVHALIAVYGLLRSSLHLTAGKAQDALLSARNSVGICPLLCTLFLGCRMRALQITQNKGMPQWWEQDFLYLCVGATIFEVVCCLTAPFFYKEVGVDTDGNATYSVQSFAGAYVITLVRYLALLGLHTGAAGVCFSVLTMTPETATGARPDSAADWQSIARTVLWGMGVMMIACVLSSAKVIGLVVKLAIESVDVLLLNAEITVDAAVLSLWRGHVIIKGLIVSNPVGSNFKCPHLLRVGIVSVKINLGRIVRSLGAQIEIGELVLNGVEVNYELGSQGKSSNIAQLLSFLEGEEAPAPAPVETKESGSFLSGVRQSASGLLGKSPTDKPPPPPPPPPAPVGDIAVDLHRILIKNVTARLLHPSMGPLISANLGTMDVEDFSKQSAGRQVGDVVIFVLKTIMRTALANADIMKTLLHQGTSQLMTSVAGKLKTKLRCWQALTLKAKMKEEEAAAKKQ